MREGFVEGAPDPRRFQKGALAGRRCANVRRGRLPSSVFCRRNDAPAILGAAPKSVSEDIAAAVKALGIAEIKDELSQAALRGMPRAMSISKTWRSAVSACLSSVSSCRLSKRARTAKRHACVLGRFCMERRAQAFSDTAPFRRRFSFHPTLQPHVRGECVYYLPVQWKGRVSEYEEEGS